VDEARVGRVPEVERAQVDEVENDQELGPAKEVAHEQHDKGKVEQVVEDKVAADGAGRVEQRRLTGPKVGDVAALSDE
jgi:hypothetical protein